MTASDLPPFDTQQVVERLHKEGGFEMGQASAIGSALVAATQRLATKRDLEPLATNSELQKLATDIQKSINAATWKFLGGVSVISAVFRWLIP